MRNLIILFLFLFLTVSNLFAKGSNVILDPYIAASKGSFEFVDSYKGDFYAIGIGGRAGAKLGPLFFAVDANAQLPYFNDSNATSTQKLNDPLPITKSWISYGVSGGLKFNRLTITYTQYFSSDLKADAAYDSSEFSQKYEYIYHGTGSKISVLLHLARNISIGAEIANYSFDQFTLKRSTTVLNAADKADRKALDINGVALLFNYKLDMTVSN